MLMGKYNKILEHINSDTLTWVSHSGVPFIICTYDKEDHIGIPNFIKSLESDCINYNIEEINLEGAILDIIDKIEGIDAVIEYEKEEKCSIAEELGDVVLDELREYICNNVNSLSNNSRVIITRVGSTVEFFPFIRLISYLEGKVHIPIIFMFPGTADKYSCKLLDRYKETAIRAVII